jgi:hypothetical protein
LHEFESLLNITFQISLCKKKVQESAFFVDSPQGFAGPLQDRKKQRPVLLKLIIEKSALFP